MNKFSELSDFEINVLVARWELMKITLFPVADAKYAEEKEAMVFLVDGRWSETELLDYCNDPSDAWPIILKNKISINFRGVVDSDAVAGEFGWTEAYAINKNPLRAAMEVFLMINSADDKSKTEDKHRD